MKVKKSLLIIALLTIGVVAYKSQNRNPADKNEGDIPCPPAFATPEPLYQPEAYTPGWGHGVKLEDCSGVIVRVNVIISNAGNGVDIKNARNVTLEENTMALNRIGLSVMGYQESSLHREHSPISLEDAGVSIVIVRGNRIFDNAEGALYVEEGSQLREEE